MKKTLLIVSLLLTNFLLSQSSKKQKQWSATDTLNISDFKIHTSHSANDTFYSQFVISYEAKGFDFMKKNLNQRVKSLFLKNASSIDTTKIINLDREIKFQQIQFDLSEVYARKFRKRLLRNKRKISKGFEILNTINNEITSEFAKQRLKLYKETNNGSDYENLKKWEQYIIDELEKLKEFRFENKKKIKIKQP